MPVCSHYIAHSLGIFKSTNVSVPLTALPLEPNSPYTSTSSEILLALPKFKNRGMQNLSKNTRGHHGHDSLIVFVTVCNRFLSPLML